MANETVRPLNIRPVGEATSATTPFNLATKPILKNGTPSAYQNKVAEKTRDYLTEQAGGAILGVHASHLINETEKYVLTCIDESMEFDRGLRQKRRCKEDQVHMDQICHHFRELTISARAATFNATTDRLVELSRRDLTPEKEEQETVIVQQDPGIFGRLFGRSQTMTVKK